MKRIILILWMVVLVGLLTGCPKSAKPDIIVPGLYETDTPIENQEYNQIKYIITEISKEEYLDADSINVIEDVATPAKKRKYYRIEVYFYFIKLERFEKVQISNLEYEEYKDYVGELYFKLDDIDIHTSFALIVNETSDKVYKQSLVLDDWIYFYLVEDDIDVSNMRFKPGLYETNMSIKNKEFNQIWYVITEISKEEYLEADSINVIEELLVPSKKKYYRMEFYFYFIKLERFEKVQIVDFLYMGDNEYIGFLDFQLDDIKIYTAVSVRVAEFNNEYTQIVYIKNEEIYFYLVEDSKGEM